jgi:hypothetical protein
MRKPVVTTITLLVAAASLLSVAGCVEKPPPVIPTGRPTAAPVFKTDAEALAAARKTYTGYLKISDQVGTDGGSNSGRLLEVVTRSWYPTEAKDYEDLAASENRYVGFSAFSKFSLQRRDESPGGTAMVGVYACLDISKSRTLNSAGKDVTPKGRIDVLPLELSFVSKNPHSSTLLLDRSEPWSGPNYCE